MKNMSDKVMKKVADGQLAAQLYKYRSLSDGSKEYTLDIFRKCELYFCIQTKLITSLCEKLKAFALRVMQYYQSKVIIYME